MDDIERIRARAHQIWEAEGRPEGREAEHWTQAQDELDQEGVSDGGSMNDLLQGGDMQVRDMDSDDMGQADGHVIHEGEGGTTAAMDEAEEAEVSPVKPEAAAPKKPRRPRAPKNADAIS
ncbi:DUF2934 domain-containing protein [Paracoccus sp. (in: a-proteobacteria)]|uniref:DUF2934 domain-containing protein n=1 Tax=Paracoccus sp. TaxID=267 RepID=UPI00396C4620